MRQLKSNVLIAGATRGGKSGLLTRNALGSAYAGTIGNALGVSLPICLRTVSEPTRQKTV